MQIEDRRAAFCVVVKMWEQFSLTSLAMVVMKAGGLAVAIRERAWRAERAESAGGLRGKPTVTLWSKRERSKNISFKCPKLMFLNPKYRQKLFYILDKAF